MSYDDNDGDKSSSTTLLLNYSSIFLLLEYSLISISGWKFYFCLQFLQLFGELLELMYSLGLAISVVTASLEPVHSEAVKITLDQRVRGPRYAD